jgi:hypothetical protein
VKAKVNMAEVKERGRSNVKKLKPKEIKGEGTIKNGY